MIIRPNKTSEFEKISSYEGEVINSPSTEIELINLGFFQPFTTASALFVSSSYRLSGSTVQTALEGLDISKIRYDEIKEGLGIQIIKDDSGYEFRVSEFFSKVDPIINSSSVEQLYQISNRCVALLVECIGGGGGGGGGSVISGTGGGTPSVGGGGGAYAQTTITGSALENIYGIPLTLFAGGGGSGGAGASGFTNTSPIVGQNGQDGQNSYLKISGSNNFLILSEGGRGGSGSLGNSGLPDSAGGNFFIYSGSGFGFSGGYGGYSKTGGNSRSTGGGGGGGIGSGGVNRHIINVGYSGGSGSSAVGVGGADETNGTSAGIANVSESFGGSGGGGGGGSFDLNATIIPGGNGGSGSLGGGGGGGGNKGVAGFGDQAGTGGPGGGGLIRITEFLRPVDYDNTNVGTPILNLAQGTFKGISAGNGISISGSTDSITIASTLQSSGSGLPILFSNRIKSISSGSGISITESNGVIIISSSATSENLEITGSGVPLVLDNKIRTISAGPNIEISEQSNGNIQISATSGSSSGSYVTANGSVNYIPIFDENINLSSSNSYVSGSNLITDGNIRITGSFQNFLYLSDGSNVERGNYTSALTIHVSPSGNDLTGTGLVSSPYQTIQKAFDECAKVQTHIPNGGVVTVQLADGTYTGAILRCGRRIYVNLNGNSSNIKAVYINGLVQAVGSALAVRNMLLRSVWAVQFGRVEIRENITFGDATANGHMEAFHQGGIYLFNNYRVSCSAAATNNRHIGLADTSVCLVESAITCSMEGVGGKFGWETLYGRQGSHYRLHNYASRVRYEITGSAPSAERYQLDFQSSIDTSGGGTSFIPGTNSGLLFFNSSYN